MAVRATGRAGAVSDEERWDQAASIARGLPTPAALGRRRRAARRYLLVLSGALVAGAATGGAVGWWTASRSSGQELVEDTGPGWLHWTGLGAGIVLVIIGVFLAVRAKQWGSAWKAPTTVLTRRQRREAVREMRGRTPAAAEHLPVVLDLARRWTATDGVILIFAGNSVLQLSLVADQPRPLGLVNALAAVAFLAGIARFLLERRRAQRFLERHSLEEC